jgi:tRNA 2-selenouridine synthase
MDMKHKTNVHITEISGFDEIIDVRTPAEFAIDHIPGSVNLPVLSNEERVIVGTMYQQDSSFAAKKLGAALVARNIANLIENHLINKPKNWKPLIYCWRGGKRSGSMGHILRQIGWDAKVLQGGYKAYRGQVLEELRHLPQAFSYLVITGRTGSAKSRVLEALHALGNQVLDLEQLANHKGSVLGGNLETPQPSQKYFESCIVQDLKKFDKNRFIYIEAESKKIGSLQVPDTLLEKIRNSPCIRLAPTFAARVEFLQRDYRYMIENPSKLTEKLSHLKSLVESKQLQEWENLILANDWSNLVASLLEKHYDKLYESSQEKNYLKYQDAPEIITDDLSESGIEKIAAQILDLRN